MKIDIRDLNDEDYLDDIYDDVERNRKPSGWGKEKPWKKTYSAERKARQKEREELEREYEGEEEKQWRTAK